MQKHFDLIENGEEKIMDICDVGDRDLCQKVQCEDLIQICLPLFSF
jgi:hypothetical protein